MCKMGINKIVGMALVALFVGSASAHASHFRYGHITWTRAPGTNTVIFTVTTAWRANAIGSTNLFYGDGASSGNITNSGPEIATGPGYSIRRFTRTHTFANEGPFISAFFASCCRISTLVNAGDDPFRVESIVDLRGGNSGSSVSSFPVIQQMIQGGVNTIPIPVGDPDADPFTCRMATSGESQVGTVATAGGFTLAVTPACDLVWDTTGTVVGQLYAAQIIIEEVHAGNTGKVALDFIIEIVGGTLNDPPVCTRNGLANNSVTVGTPFSITLTGTDPDGDNLSVNHLGLPAGATLTPPAGTTAPEPFVVTFDWTPTLADLGTTNAVTIVFEDLEGLQATCGFTVTVPDNDRPVCDANGPYSKPCTGSSTSIQLDGSGSSDPDTDPLSFLWTTDCPGGSFDNATSATPILTVGSIATCPLTCNVGLAVSDRFFTTNCTSTVKLTDGTLPTVNTPPDLTVCCADSVDPSNTGNATATDNCDQSPALTHGDSAPPSDLSSATCPQTITRTWTATDDCGNVGTGVQLIQQNPCCGNGILEGPEECDDGNTVDGDGCSSTCLPEGACCLADKKCIDMSSDDCLASGGNPGGPGSQCSALEACCLPVNDVSAWERRADFVDPRTGSGIEGASASLIGDKIYVSHGYRFGDRSFLSVYDTIVDAWTHGGATAPDAAVARSEMAGGTAFGKHYAIGGRTGPNAAVEEFDPGTSTWTTKAPLPSGARGGLAACSWGNKIYAIGGRTGSTFGSGTILSTNECYDPGTDTWTVKASLPIAVSDNYATIGYNGRCYVFGGATSPGTVISDVQIYDIATDAWLAGAPMPTARGAAMAGLCGDRLAVFGGYDASTNLAVTEIYDPGSDTWVAGPPMLQTVSEVAQGVISNGKEIYSIGTGIFGASGSIVQVLHCAQSCQMLDPLCCAAQGGSPQGPGAVCTALEACCFSDNTCQMEDPLCCLEQGGTPQGSESTCGGIEACCDSDTGACYTADRTCCLANSDTPQGPGTTCSAPEACCFGDNTCQMLDPLCCANSGGTPQGPGSTCGGTEACCDADTGACYTADRTCCLANGDSPQGPGTSCTAPEACCLGDNTCQMLDPLCCANLGGTPEGPGSTCGGTEACCDSGSGACYTADRTCCLANGDSPQGPGTACTAPQECCFSNATCTDLDPLCCVDQGGTPSGTGSECGTCDDGVCDCDEDFGSCCQDCDCPACSHCEEICTEGRACRFECVSDCGDGTCDPACENCVTCAEDCGCGACTTCNAVTGTCDPDCGNGVCQPECGENCRTCPVDCGCDACDDCTFSGACVSGCGDGTCDPNCETCSSCPQDCHDCGDGCCSASAGETCCSCSQDCGPCCGNGVCDNLCGEDCSSCPDDCQLPDGETCMPTTSEWGLMILLLALLTGIAIKFGFRRRPLGG